jgi:hypothetical protein
MASSSAPASREPIDLALPDTLEEAAMNQSRTTALSATISALTISALSLAASLAGACSKQGGSPGPAGVPPLIAPASAAPPSASSPLGLDPGSGAAALAAAAAAAEAEVPEVPDPKETISGTIVLPGAHRGKVSRGDVMFLAARRMGGPSGPGSMLAVQKLVVEDFPMAFSLSSRDAMIPGVPFEGRVSITIRVDKDGDAMTRRKGDVYGEATGVSVGSQKVVVVLDKVQTEDKTLGQPGADMMGGLPPGHP